MLPLRAARRGLSARSSAVVQAERAKLRKRAGALELACERIENELLAAHALGLTVRTDRVAQTSAAIENLRGYLEQIGAGSEAVNAARVELMVRALAPVPVSQRPRRS